MNTLLWTMQAMLAFVFLAHGLLFLFPSKAMRKIKEQSPFPAGLMQLIYVAEVLAPFGLILPGLTGLLPWLTPLAAAGLVPIMCGAVPFHLSRGEVPPTVITAVLLALAAFVAYARWFALPL
ncbi:DoxX family protein [Rubrobacter tropicus]|nr:DoxX family protein [Rubrobacter tropicus]